METLTLIPIQILYYFFIDEIQKGIVTKVLMSLIFVLKKKK